MFRVALFVLVTFFIVEAEAIAAQESPLVLYRDWHQCGYPDWSPDGKWIVFTAGQTEDAEGNLWIIPAAGGEPLQITEGGGHHGSFSHDSKLIAFDALAGTVVQVVPGDGGTAIRVVPEEIPVEHSGNPCWSPDGKRLAFRAGEDLYTVELATGKFSMVFHKDGYKPLPIQWLKMENSIITSLINVEDRTAILWEVNLEVGEMIKITDVPRVTQATVSPDESMLVYSAFCDPEEQDYDLWAIPLNGGEPIQLTAGPMYDLEPCWSPNGDKLAYVVFFEGEFRIQVIDLSVKAINAGWEPLNEWDPMI